LYILDDIQKFYVEDRVAFPAARIMKQFIEKAELERAPVVK
jgi:hypothetical protein